MTEDPLSAPTLSRHQGSDEVIRVENLRQSRGDTLVLDGVSFVVNRGERLVIMGGSGCGKSTLLHAMVGATKVDSGAIYLFGRNIVGLPDEEMDEIRRRFGILFQSGALFGSMTVGENIALPIREHSNLPDSVIEIMIKMKLLLVNLSGYENQMPENLSGGQAKRIGLARAMALEPELLFYDEPTSGLDPISAADIDDLVVRMSQNMHITTVVVTHDVNSAFKIADKIIILHDKRIVESGTPEQIRNSRHPYVQRFINSAIGGTAAAASGGSYDAVRPENETDRSDPEDRKDPDDARNGNGREDEPGGEP